MHLQWQEKLNPMHLQWQENFRVLKQISIFNKKHLQSQENFYSQRLFKIHVAVHIINKVEVLFLEIGILSTMVLDECKQLINIHILS